MTPPWNGPVHGPPSARPGRVRRHKIFSALLPALALVLAVGITVSILSDSHPVRGTTSPPQVAAVTRGARWLSGPAGQLLKAVNADLGRLSTGERSGKPGIAKTAGTRLAMDAKAALNGPLPPVDAKIYRSALKDLERAGTYAANGVFSKSNTLLNAGDSDITKVTSSVNPPATANPSAAVIEPNGQ